MKRARSVPVRVACVWTLGALLAVALPGCSAEVVTPAVTAEHQALQGTIDPRRSLAVTDTAILARFPLKRVLDQLVAQSGVAGLTSRRLFQQWWDVMNPRPGLAAGPHCNDQIDASGPVLNGYPFVCRPAPSEGWQASCDPFAAGSACAYTPIGLFNRFDLMPENGAYCGEYRVVYAKSSGITNPDDRNLVIFEAALPNPLPLLGIEGCRPVIELWASLSDIDDVQTRAARLEALYFQGLLAVPPFPPVINIAHFGPGSGGRGQIRTNQFMNPSPRVWSLREFKLQRSCGLLSCSALRFVPVTAKGNPYGLLFAPTAAHPRAPAFQAFLPGQVGTLSGATIPEIAVAIPDSYNSGQSEASGTTEGNLAVQLGSGASPLRAALTSALASSTLTADHVVARVQAQTCAGCHRISNNADLGGGITWPPSLGFTHISERETELIDGSTSYVLSPALNDVFLPHREVLLERYLSRSLVLRLITPLQPIGGLLVH
jgi:hypothetical protein